MDICLMLIKYLIIIILLFSCQQNQAEELEDIYQSIVITYSKIKFYEADFEQENYWKELDITQTSQGKIYFDMDNFLMQYFQPEGQFLLIRNDIVTMYDAASNQAMITKNMDIELRPLNLITDYWEHSSKKLDFAEDDLIKLTFITQNADQISIVLENHLLAELLILDENGNFVLYKFKNEKINKDLPIGIFEIDLPEDANLIDNSN